MVRMDGAVRVPAMMLRSVVEALFENVHAPPEPSKVVEPRLFEPVSVPAMVFPVVVAVK